MIARIAFSKRLGLVSGSGDDGGEDWKQLADSLQRFLGNAGRVGRYQPLANAAERTAAESGLPLPKIDVPGLSQLQADTAVMEQYEKLLIDQRRESQQLAVDAGAADEDALGGDLLGTLMRTHVAGSETPLSDADVQANVREAFVAGSETTAAAISLTLQLVSANPRIEWLVRKELHTRRNPHPVSTSRAAPALGDGPPASDAGPVPEDPRLSRGRVSSPLLWKGTEYLNSR